MKRFRVVVKSELDAIWICENCLDELEEDADIIDRDNDPYEEGCYLCGDSYDTY